MAVKLTISEMGGKLEHIPALNTNPLKNPFCQKMSKIKGTVCSHCYSIRACRSYRSLATVTWDKNASILSREMKDEEFPIVSSVLFRFNSHGELLGKRHFLNLCEIAKRNPRTTFSLWTKRANIVQENIQNVPDNMILVFSGLFVDKIAKRPKHFHKVFNVVSKDKPHNCGALSCWGCSKCYELNNGQDNIVEKIK